MAESLGRYRSDFDQNTADKFIWNGVNFPRWVNKKILKIEGAILSKSFYLLLSLLASSLVMKRSTSPGMFSTDSYGMHFACIERVSIQKWRNPDRCELMINRTKCNISVNT